MKYSNQIEIDLPIDEVIELFNNPDNMKHWQEGFESFESLSGEPGKEGSTAKLKYKMGKKDIEMIETINKNNLPSEFHGTYELPGIWNSVNNYFESITENKTLWRSEAEFVFSSIMMKIFGLLMPGSFKKQSLTFMNNFKAFAEEGKSVNQ